jgi:hypothetical protein
VLAEVATAFVDASAASLRLALDLPPQPALQTTVVEAGGFRVELRVLGASHQCIARRAGGAELSETVACLQGAPGGPLPASHDRAEDGLRYTFTSTVEHVGAEALRTRAEALRAAAAADPRALAGVFPGSPDALTALRCEPVAGGVGWTTVHLYPHTGELVETSTTVVAA